MALRDRRTGILIFLGTVCATLFRADLLRAAPKDAGNVLALSGACFVEAGNGRVPLKSGDLVHAGDMVEASAGARLKIRLSDGSIISLGSGTRTRIETVEVGGSSGRTVRLTLMGGLLRAVVTAFSQPSRFEIGTATGVAAVRSTDWFIEASQESTQVGVLDGRVGLTSVATGRTVEIPARWGARVEPGRDPVPGRIWTTAEFDAVIARTNTDPGP